MTYRMNIVLDEGAWQALQEIPRGERSRLICQAIKKLADEQRRKRSAETMDRLRQKLPKVSTEDLASWIRSDRSR